METTETSESIKLSSTIEKASSYKQRLHDKDIVFWLSFFYKVMPHSDILFNQFPKKITESHNEKQHILSFEAIIQSIRDDIDSIIKQVISEVSEIVPAKRPRIDDDGSNRKRDALEVCDAILSEIKFRFQFSRYFIASNH